MVFDEEICKIDTEIDAGSNDNIKEIIEKTYKVERRDMDINGHMHNLNYLDLIAELMDFDEEFDKFRIIYKKEIKYGQDVCVLRKDKVDSIQFLIKDKDNVVHSIIECKK